MEVQRARSILTSARSISEEVKKAGLCAPLPSQREMYDALITDPGLRNVTRSLFMDGHYSLAVQKACTYLNGRVKKECRLDSDGASLMRTAFSAAKPVLKLNSLTDQSDRDEQQGYMDIFAGCMMGVRNPRAHEPENRDNPQTALELLVLTHHLLGKVRSAERVESSEKRSSL